MAIIDSIAMGKASGKIGNIVLSYEKGQALARSCPTRGKRKSSPAQVTNKQKFSAAYTFYIWQKLFLSNIRKLCTPKEQLYNAFLRLYYKVLPDSKPGTLYNTFYPFISSNVGYYGAFEPLGIAKTNTAVLLKVKAMDGFWTKKLRLAVILINTVSGNIVVKKFSITKTQWTENYYQVPTENSLFNYGAFYLYSTDKSVMSKILYCEITNF